MNSHAASGSGHWLWQPVCHYGESGGYANSVNQKYHLCIIKNSPNLGTTQVTLIRRIGQ